MKKKRNWASFFGVNLFVLILYALMILLAVFGAAFGILLATKGGVESMTDIGSTTFMLLIAIGEALVIGVPVVLFISVGRTGRTILKLSRPRAVEILLTFGMAVGGFGVFFFLQILTQRLLSSLNLPVQGLEISFSSVWQLLAWIGALGVLPAVVEEFAFRGIVLGVYEQRLRPFWAILLSGVLFGVLHMQVAFFYFYIGLGVILGWVVYRSRSLWTGILYHFTHNTLAVVLAYISQTYIDASYQPEPAALDGAALGAWGIIAAGSLVIFLGCLFPFARLTRGRAPVVEKPVRSPFTDWSPLLVIAIGLVLLIGLTVLGALLISFIMENMPIP